MQQLPAGLDENFRFMILEVRKQLEETLSCLAEPTVARREKITNRDDYIDSMKGLIEEKSFSCLVGQPMERGMANALRCLITMASNLERIADFAVNVVGQLQYLGEPRILTRYDYQPYFDEVLAGLEMISPALERRDLSLALGICQCEFHLDDLFKATMGQILTDLQKGKRTGELVTALFIYRYLERMGDSLLNIGEALIFVLVGERLKIHQYEALQDTLAASGLDAPPMSQVEFSSFWGNRSGCKVGAVADKSDSSKAHRVIFKEGARSKILAEKQGIDHWQQIMPGLPPRIFGFQENNGQASLLLEYLSGCTVQEVLLTAADDVVQNALFLLVETMGAVWRATRTERPGRADFIGQLLSRLEDVYRVHPRFEGEAVRIGPKEVPSVGMLVRRVQEVEAELCCPFSVLIHGDFNLNNIIYDHKQQRLHYLDLHRSDPSDYVQDVSVFIASCLRLPVFEPALRRRLGAAAQEILAFARAFAEQNRDETFEARLALGLIRALMTSTRFELNEDFAHHLYLNSLYLMEKIIGHRGRPWAEFKLPGQVLVSLEVI